MADDADRAPEPETGPPHGRWPAVRALQAVEGAAAGVLLVLLVGLVVFQVVTRYVFDAPATWTEELARFAMIWMAFVAAAYVMARARHITVVLFTERVGRRLAAAMAAFAGVLVATTSVAMAFGGIAFAASVAQLDAPATGLPVALVYSAATVGFALVAVHAALGVWVAWRHPEAARTGDPTTGA